MDNLLNLCSIVCRDRTTHVIGINDHIPWKHNQDLNLFKKITSAVPYDNMVNILICGYKTYRSLPESFNLKTRKLFVIADPTREIVTHIQDAIFYTGPIDVVQIIQIINEYILELQPTQLHKIFIIGGSQIYNLFDPFVTELILGELDMQCHMSPVPEKKENNNVVKFDFTEFIPVNTIYEHADYIIKKYIPDQNHPERLFLSLMKKILIHGNQRNQERTGACSRSLFSETLEIDLSDGYCPLMQTRQMPAKQIVAECRWYYSGSTNVDDLRTISGRDKTVWDANTSREFLDKQGQKDQLEGDIGPSYGFQFRHAGAEYKDKLTDYTNCGIDQIKELLSSIKSDPESRRHIVELWNVKDLSKMALPPCLRSYQFYTRKQVLANGNIVTVLDCEGIQRSSDYFLAGYWNIYQVAYFVYYVIHELKKENVQLYPGKIKMMYGDIHLYNNAIEQSRNQIKLIDEDLTYYTVQSFTPEEGFVANEKYISMSKLTAKMN